MKKNLIVTLTNEKYIDQAKQLFSSVYWNAGWKGDYMLLSYNIPEKKLKWFRKKGIIVKECFFFSDTFSKRWSPVVLGKFCLFSTEFKKWKNVIFLDADIIVKASLEDLTKIKGFAAVRSHKQFSKLLLKPLYIKLEKRNIAKYYELKKKYDFNSPVFGTSMIAFSTDIIDKKMFSKLKDYSNKYIQISAGADELPINILLYKKWIKLPLYIIFILII